MCKVRNIPHPEKCYIYVRGIMRIFEADISPISLKFIQERLTSGLDLSNANALFHSASGIVSFFETEAELQELKDKLSSVPAIPVKRDRTDYGDFQTNPDLAIRVTNYLSTKIDSPDIIIEPTCGEGSFIVAALKTFKTIRQVYGVEIYQPYVWGTKLSILDYFLESPDANRPEIFIRHDNVFDLDFDAIAAAVSRDNTLILGNPPWVTNSMLGDLDSSNLPAKSNFKGHRGLDAMTGKGNFDIAEYITMTMLRTFQHLNGNIALLVKNAVIRNIVFDQKKIQYKLGKIEQHGIDSKKEFNASVDAALFFARLNEAPSLECGKFDFYNHSRPLSRFGWVDEKFVSNIETYVRAGDIDGECPFEWRQGLKHDCSSIMELEKLNGAYVNALNEEVELENGLVYGLLKSSDLKETVIKTSRKFTIVTQRKIGQETSYIQHEYPKTYRYLLRHQDSFEARKSSIYRGKPVFSIFGVGDYSFKPFKVVISGFYKRFAFCLVLPDKKKPRMLDDTCYMIGFDNLDYAVYTLILLNAQATKDLLQSISFQGAKRTITKDVLMRIDLGRLSDKISACELRHEVEKLNRAYVLNASADNWNSFVDELKPAPRAPSPLAGSSPDWQPQL